MSFSGSGESNQPSGCGERWRLPAGIFQGFAQVKDLSSTSTHNPRGWEKPHAGRPAWRRSRQKPHTCVTERARKPPQHLPETGASWEVMERCRLISALRKQSQRILGRRFIVNKIYKVVENSQKWMVERVDSYLWMFLSPFRCFCRTQLQKLRILKIHFNLTLLLLSLFFFSYLHKCTGEKLHRRRPERHGFLDRIQKWSTLCSLYMLALGPSPPPQPGRRSPTSRWTCCGWRQWLRAVVLRRLLGRTVAWGPCQGSGGRAPRWGPCVCTARCH